MKRHFQFILVALAATLIAGHCGCALDPSASRPSTSSCPCATSVRAPHAELVEIAKDLQLSEGPAADHEGNLFFADVRANKILKWTPDGELSTFRADTAAANGLALDSGGNIIACEGAAGRIVSFGPAGQMTVVVDQYRGKRFNQPNDLWIDRKGGIYFSDPVYGKAEHFQDAEAIYYITPDRKEVIRVISDIVRPNGLVGSRDGRTLYATDRGAGKTFCYTIHDDGTISDKKPFAERSADGMKIDNEGNVYLADDAIYVYTPPGQMIERIALPQRATNLCFGGKDGHTLFITAKKALYSLAMRVHRPQ